MVSVVDRNAQTCQVGLHLGIVMPFFNTRREFTNTVPLQVYFDHRRGSEALNVAFRHLSRVAGGAADKNMSSCHGHTDEVFSKPSTLQDFACLSMCWSMAMAIYGNDHILITKVIQLGMQ